MEGRRPDTQRLLDRLFVAAKAIGRDIAFMEVCGTHTMSAFRCGLHGLLPPNVRLLSGPGCPVCVTAQADIDLMIELADRPRVTLCTYGDMLRVPGARGSLELARSRGADVRVVYSALDALRLAEAEPDREVVFAAVGFETTAPATAALVVEAHRRGLPNLTVLASHKRILPAMNALMQAGEVEVDGFLCPGHVSIVIGAEAYRTFTARYHMPCVVAGFEDWQMILALTHLAEQVCDGRTELENAYPEAVRPQGNPTAVQLLAEVFESADARWRGLGEIAGSALVVRRIYATFDARARFGLVAPVDREPAGCRCGAVISGSCSPEECRLFGTACTPVRPIGPCMVSSEGTCQAWFKYRRRVVTEDVR